jgi:hypothetical protein
MDEGSTGQDFLHRLDSGELDGKLFEEMNKLSYEQLLQVGSWLAERHVARARGKRAERASQRYESSSISPPAAASRQERCADN